MLFSLKDLAVFLNGKLVGDPSVQITGVNSPDKAGPKEICYLEKTENLELAAIKAGCVILGEKELSSPVFPFPVIFVKNPKLAFAKILGEIEKEKLSCYKPGISHLAYVSKSAKISQSAYIGPFCHIEENAFVGDNCILISGVYLGKNSSLGKNCLIYSNVSIREGCLIDRDCIIHCGCVIGSDGYGYIPCEKGHMKMPQIGAVKIGERCELGANVCVDRATMDFTEIGDGSKIDNLVHIAHNVKIGKNCLIIAQAGIAGSSKIGDNVIIAGQAGISDHVEIGDNSIIMAKTGVMGKVKPGSVLFGYLGRPRGEYMRIEALLSKLPDFFNFYKKAKKLIDLDEKNNR